MARTSRFSTQPSLFSLPTVESAFTQEMRRRTGGFTELPLKSWIKEQNREKAHEKRKHSYLAPEDFKALLKRAREASGG